MKNVVTTIPKGRFKTWPLAERIVRKCDGEKEYWTIYMTRPPATSLVGSLCYMIFDGQIRGYFDIVDVDAPKNWEWHKDKSPSGQVLVMANWHPISDGPEMTGFQGWRYTQLRP